MSDTNNITIISKIEFINDHFKIPITFIKNTELRENITNDLELVKCIDPSNCSPVYNYAFQPKTKCGNKVLEQISKYYTTDVDYLNENQELLKSYSLLSKNVEKKVDNDTISNNIPEIENTIDNTPDNNKNLETIIELWDEIKNDTGFKEKYYYLDWTYLEHLNKSESFLQMMKNLMYAYDLNNLI